MKEYWLRAWLFVCLHMYVHVHVHVHVYVYVVGGGSGRGKGRGEEIFGLCSLTCLLVYLFACFCNVVDACLRACLPACVFVCMFVRLRAFFVSTTSQFQCISRDAR